VSIPKQTPSLFDQKNKNEGPAVNSHCNGSQRKGKCCGGFGAGVGVVLMLMFGCFGSQFDDR
jgi:hypothetical protein